MNVLIKCVLVLLTLSSCTHGTTYYNRKVGPFTKFDNPDNVPVDDYIGRKREVVLVGRWKEFMRGLQEGKW